MRILPVIAAVAAAFLVVSCSTPAPPQGVTVVRPFNASNLWVPGMKLPVLTIAMSVPYNR